MSWYCLHFYSILFPYISIWTKIAIFRKTISVHFIKYKLLPLTFLINTLKLQKSVRITVLGEQTLRNHLNRILSKNILLLVNKLRNFKWSSADLSFIQFKFMFGGFMAYFTLIICDDVLRWIPGQVNFSFSIVHVKLYYNFILCTF